MLLITYFLLSHFLYFLLLIWSDVQENPFNCDCGLVGLWEWLHNHPRLLDSQEKNLTCIEPNKINDRFILLLYPIDFCPVPIILIFEVFKLESNEMTLHWEVQNNSLIDEFRLDYHLTSDRIPVFTYKQLSSLDRYNDLTDLKSETWYTVCLQAESKYSRIGSKKPAAYVMHHQLNFEYTSNNRKCVQVCAVVLSLQLTVLKHVQKSQI